MFLRLKIFCFHLPADFNLISQKVFQLKRLTQRNASLLDIPHPHPVDHFVPEVPAEGPFVAQESGRDQTVTHEMHALLLQFLQVLFPSIAKRELLSDQAGTQSGKEEEIESKQMIKSFRCFINPTRECSSLHLTHPACHYGARGVN